MFTSLETERLYLKCIDLDDAPFFYIYAHIAKDNIASACTAKGAGFTDTGKTYDEVFRNVPYPHRIWCLDVSSGTDSEKNADIRLVRPGREHAAQVMAFREDILKSDDTDPFAGCAGLENTESYTEWLNFDERLRRVYGEGYVPSEVFLGIRKRDNKVIGIIDYRHPLSDFLLRFGGNIGYSILPSERRKGYGTQLLRLMLDVCREYGEKRVLISCDRENEASRRTILSCGGILENEVQDTAETGFSGIIQRYWITL